MIGTDWTSHCKVVNSLHTLHYDFIKERSVCLGKISFFYNLKFNKQSKAKTNGFCVLILIKGKDTSLIIPNVLKILLR